MPDREVRPGCVHRSTGQFSVAATGNVDLDPVVKQRQRLQPRVIRCYAGNIQLFPLAFRASLSSAAQPAIEPEKASLLAWIRQAACPLYGSVPVETGL